MKKLLVFAVSGVVSFACFGAPTATRTYVDNTVKAATNAVVLYVNQKIAEIDAGGTDGITQAQAEAIAAVAATTAKNEAIAEAASDAAIKASNAKSEAISAAADDATIKANAAKTEAISTAGSNADTKIATAIASKADDSAVVKLTGNQTIAGKKTFSTLPAIPQTPSANTDAASKGYVDSSASSVISTIDSRGYLTSHQSLAAYSTTAQMNTAIKNATSGLAKASEVTSQISTATAPLAQDSAVVKLTGNQSVAGNKSFAEYVFASQSWFNFSGTSAARAWAANIFSAPARSFAVRRAGMPASAGTDVSTCFSRNSAADVRGPANAIVCAAHAQARTIHFVFMLIFLEVGIIQQSRSFAKGALARHGFAMRRRTVRLACRTTNVA